VNKQAQDAQKRSSSFLLRTTIEHPLCIELPKQKTGRSIQHTCAAAAAKMAKKESRTNLKLAILDEN
jgi:hypothetical protein